MFKRCLAAFLLPAFGSAMADSCLPFLSGSSAPDSAASDAITLVSLNHKDVATYVPLTRVEHLPPLKVPSNRPGASDPEMFRSYNSQSVPTPQLFSDRKHMAQPFDVASADLVLMSLTVEAAPQIILAFTSHGFAKTRFRVDCSASGVMHGSTADADYLLLKATLPQ